MSSRILFVVATTAVIVIDGDKVPLTCLQLKNNAPGISYQGEKLQCYAPADGGANGCDKLGLHSWQAKELDACRRCCPIVTTTNRPKRPSTTRPTVTKVKTLQVNQNHGKGKVSKEKTWIYVIIGVLGAAAVVAVAALVAYHKCKGSHAAEVAGAGAGVEDVERAGGDGEQEEVPLGGIQPSEVDDNKLLAA